MKEGMLLVNEEGLFTLEDVIFKGEGEEIIIFDEDENNWLEGKVEKDQFGEYYFTDGFLVVYLFEGLPARVNA